MYFGAREPNQTVVNPGVVAKLGSVWCGEMASACARAKCEMLLTLHHITSMTQLGLQAINDQLNQTVNAGSRKMQPVQF